MKLSNLARVRDFIALLRYEEMVEKTKRFREERNLVTGAKKKPKSDE